MTVRLAKFTYSDVLIHFLNPDFVFDHVHEYVCVCLGLRCQMCLRWEFGYFSIFEPGVVTLCVVAPAEEQ